MNIAEYILPFLSGGLAGSVFTFSERRADLETSWRKPTRRQSGEAIVLREERDKCTAGFRRGIWRRHACTGKLIATREASVVAGRSVVVMISGNAEGAKGPQF